MGHTSEIRSFFAFSGSNEALIQAPTSSHGLHKPTMEQLIQARKDSQKNLLSGFTAGAICKVGEYPFDTVKVLLQSHPTRYKGPIDCLRQTYRKNGLKGLYKGVTTPVLGAMGETATLFVSYGLMKRALDVNTNPTLSNPVPMYKYLISGAFSGFCTAFVLTPVELVKCNLQVQNINKLDAVQTISSPISGTQNAPIKSAATTAAATVSSQVAYTGPLDVIRKTVKKNGITGLWKGNLSCLMREIPGNIAWFGMYEFIKGRVLQKALGYEEQKDLPLVATMLSGSLAGVSYWFIPYPADTVKSQIQTKEKFSGMSFRQVFMILYRQEGLRGMYKGCGVTVARAAVSHAFLFYIYEVCYKYLGYVIN